MIQPIPTQSSARDKLLDDLRTVVSDAEQWLRQGSHLTGEELLAAKDKFERTLRIAKDDIIKFEEALVAKTKEAAKATDEYVHENPWKSVGIGAAAGLVIGLLIARR
ncbi:MAG TPA: DUF883 domain-containing protein, partial [Ramlibacter sp.]|nr:DUF883 domain-containing protein [Ramlibacter sp.]